MEAIMKKFRELKASQLRWQCDPKILKFKSVNDLHTYEGIIGQPRAIEAIKLGLNVRYPGYNIFITGPVGTGRTTAITKLLEEMEVKKGDLKDLLYINNFKNPDMPKLMDLPSSEFRKDSGRTRFQGNSGSDGSICSPCDNSDHQ
jgi:Cdc6-like AAA superfamily ATPase